MDDKILINEAVDILNEAFAADPGAINALMCNRVPCNEALTNHPTIPAEQILTGGTADGVDRYAVGALGLLNGVLGPITGHRVGIMWGPGASEEGPHRCLGFCVVEGQING